MWNYQRMMWSKEGENTVLSYNMASAGLQQDNEEIKTTNELLARDYKFLVWSLYRLN